MDKSKEPKKKTPYQPPKLTVYGDIRELTKQVFARRTRDGRTFFGFPLRTQG